MSKKPQVILEEELRPVVEAEGLELVEIEIAGGGRQRFVRLFVDKPQGVSVEDCGRLSRRVAPLIEALELFGDRYVLEVSSPGVTRGLKREEDFVRFTGRLARLSLSEPVLGHQQWVGELSGLDGTDILLLPSDGADLVKVPQVLVRAARLEYESPQEREARHRRREPQT
jgi:ribosome maturation factor RimP